ncbi:MAG: FxsA family protein [Solirubrobacterales bacterium]|nr:FxsA family protein [Solirubrobacterales bacterium]
MLVLALLGVAALEVFAFVEVARAIDWPWALLLLLGTSALGTRLLGIQRRLAVERVSRAVAERRATAGGAIDGALGFLGSVLLAFPGFVTDLLGTLLILRPTRSLARRWVSHRYAPTVMRFAATAERFGGGARGAPAADVDSTAVEHEPDQLNG